MTIFYIVCIAVLLALDVVLYLYWLRMFQQNSYRADRFLRWFRTSPLPRLRAKSKLPLVMTPRMVRLTVTAGLIVLVANGVSLLSVGTLFWLPLLCLLCLPFVILLANAVNSPIEKAITGHYIEDARKIIASRPDLIIIGVTGSYGKTSTKNYLYRILSEKYNVLMTPGNYNTTLGVVRTIREQLQPWHQVFIVEMGAKQKGDIKEICELVHPSIGVVTAVGEMHLETFGSIDAVLKTKFELIDSLPSDGHGFVNADSPMAGAYAASEEFRCPITLYGIDAHRADVRASGIRFSSSGMSFSLTDRQNTSVFTTPLQGEANVLDLMAAIEVARLLGVDDEKIRIAAGKLHPVEHRLSVSRRGTFTVIDDAYNSNPVGSKMALKMLASFEIPQGAVRICITPGFVELGDRQYEECRKLGEVAGKSADYLVVVNRYNRDAIKEGALGAGMPQERILLADTLADTPSLLAGVATPGSVLLYENDLPDTFI